MYSGLVQVTSRARDRAPGRPHARTVWPGAPWLVAALLFAAPAVAAGPAASAAPVDPIDAKYESALVDLDEGRFQSACPKLEAVVAARPDQLIAHYKLGGCYLALGKLASAWSRFVHVRDAAKKAGNFKQSFVAGNSARSIERKLAKLTIVVPPAVAETPGLAVRCDGVRVEQDGFGKPRPADKGAHRIEVTAPGKARWEKSVTIEADGKTLSVTLEPLAAAPPDPPPEAGGSRAWQRPVAYVAGGLGLAGIAAGAATFALALQKKDESLHDCLPNDHCNEAGFRVRNEARSFGDGSTAALIAGGVLLSAGVVLFATAPGRIGSDPRPGDAGAVRARVVLGAGRLTVVGTW